MNSHIRLGAALAVLAFALAAGSAAAVAEPASGDPNADLRRQVQSLEKRLAELEKIAPAASAAPATPATPAPAQPFDFADFTWLNGTSRERANPFDSRYFTPELRLDANSTYDFNHPKDHTLDGSCEVGRQPSEACAAPARPASTA